MAQKLEKVYKELLPLKVVTFDEIVDKVREITDSKKSQHIYRKYVKKLVEGGKLERIRKGLYAVLSLLDTPEKYAPDKFLIASKIRCDYYLGYHTALEFYGCAYSHFNEVYIAIKKKDRFDPFQYRGFKFRPVFVQDTSLSVEEKRYLGHNVKVSSKERTFIDCLERVRYAGGWEESFKSLQGLGGLDFNSIDKTLSSYNNALLFRKSGFVLELLQDTSLFYEHFSDRMLNRLHRKI
ncbi:MAG: type IV toxin-antitoxin system AbiEi family antitoxin, partial [Thermodesulfobacteriota bacterium]